MSTAAPRLSDNSCTATRKVQERFVIVPSTDNRPRFRDLLNMRVAPQGNPSMLLQAYRDAGGTGDITGEYLLSKLPLVFAEDFFPGNYSRIVEIEGNRLLNMWTGPTIRPSGAPVSQQDAAPFVEFLHRLFPIQEERRYFLQWLAHAVRYPGTRINATVLLRSAPGVGKGFLAETILPGLLGKSSVGVVALSEVIGNFNDPLVGKTLILIDEVVKKGGAAVHALKSIQGNRTITLRRKYVPDTTVDNYLSFLMSSNDVRPLTLEREDRRFWVPAYIEHEVSIEETDYFLNVTLKPWLTQQGGMQIVRDLLETVDLSTFHAGGKPPMTDSKQHMIGIAHHSPLNEFVAGQIKLSFVVKALDIEAHYLAQTGETLSNRAVPSELAAQGCLGKRTSTGRWWITPGGLANGLSEKTSPAQLKAAYLSGREV